MEPYDISAVALFEWTVRPEPVEGHVFSTGFVHAVQPGSPQDATGLF